MPDAIYRYWAKTGDAPDEYHRLPYHLLDVAAAMQVLLQRSTGAVEHLQAMLGVESGFERTLVWFAGLHDIGKFANSFQSLSPPLQAALGTTSNGVPYSARHDALGGYLLEELLCSREASDLLSLDPAVPPGRERRKVLRTLIEAVAGHHGAPCAPNSRQTLSDAFEPSDREAANAFITAWTALIEPSPRWAPCSVEAFRTHIHRGSWAVAGWMVLADWIGSNRAFFPYETGVVPLEEYWARALRLAENAVTKSGVIAPQARTFSAASGLFEFDHFTPMQRFAETTPLGAGPHLFVLEDATGSGKTEAALILASRLMSGGLANGVYIGLPTTATANGMFSRMRVAYDRFFDGEAPSIVLAHGSRKLSPEFRQILKPADGRPRASYDRSGDDETGEATCAAWLGDTARKALLAPFGVGTIDQALLGVLPVRYQALRLVGMARKVLIIDEVHAYDVYMSSLLATLLEFHASQGGSAILLSATLSHAARQKLVDAFARGAGRADETLRNEAFPLATQLDGSAGIVEERMDQNGSPTTGKETPVRLVHTFEECVDHLVGTALDGGCGCWIRNTVDEAAAAYAMLRARLHETGGDPDRVTLFHARFTRADRQAIEAEVLSRFSKESTKEDRAGRLVVATQVIEQSLDLDFDSMVSDLAPIDLLIQRAGRLHRHDHRLERKPPALLVYGPELVDDIPPDWCSGFFEGTQWVYRDHSLLWKTARVLAERGVLRIPDEARLLVESVYGADAPPAPAALEASEDEALAEEMVHRSMARFSALEFSMGYSNGSNGGWLDDSRAATRLGEETVRLRLGELSDGVFVPLHRDQTRWVWEMSELTVNAWKFKSAAVPDKTRAALDRARREMFDKGKYVELVPLVPVEADTWSCPIEDASGRPRTLLYSHTHGLQFTET